MNAISSAVFVGFIYYVIKRGSLFRSVFGSFWTGASFGWVYRSNRVVVFYCLIVPAVFVEASKRKHQKLSYSRSGAFEHTWYSVCMTRNGGTPYGLTGGRQGERENKKKNDFKVHTS